MLADFESEELAPLYRAALRIAKNVARLRIRTQRAGIPTLFINDNFGRWRSSEAALIDRVAKSARGKAILELLAPRSEDYIILKPKHSTFFATPLRTLLSYIGADSLILTGLSSTQCILFSAIDAYVRDYRLYIPANCVVSAGRKDTHVADYLFREYLHADTRPAERLRISTLRANREN
jgi:isochorismate hydrolase